MSPTQDPDFEEQLMRDLMKTFKAEAAEHLETLNRTFLRLERYPEEAEQKALLEEAFRAVHSLKGAARAVSLDQIEELAHIIENVMQQARAGEIKLEAATFDAFYDALDAINGMLEGQQVEFEAIGARLSDTNNPAPPESAGQDHDVTESDAGPEQAAESASSEVLRAETPQADSIRVTVNKLDDLMAQAGELLVAKISAEQRQQEIDELSRLFAQWSGTWNALKRLMPEAGGESGRQITEAMARHDALLQTCSEALNDLNQAMRRDTTQLSTIAANLQDEVRRVRMVPFQTIALGLERAVRDMARSEGKQIAFTLCGEEVEIDKKVLESLKDPLLHLLRNAVTHGIETPDARRQKDKPAEGRVKLNVQQRSGEVQITVSDDGRGFDLDALREAGKRAGIENLDGDKNALLSVAFLPGVTTMSGANALAGRGVGLDVVRQKLNALQGRIEVESETGIGATIRLVVPVSLVMSQGLLVKAGAEQYVIPLNAVEKIERPDRTFTVEGRTMFTLDDDKSIPLVTLSHVLEMPNGQTGENPFVLVLSVAEQRLALMVDEVMSEYELAVKPLGKPIMNTPNITGAALLGTGEPVVVLNPGDLIQSAKGRNMQAVMTPKKIEQAAESQRETSILVVDDSITTRTLEKNILEAAGYRVTVATDGREALRQLEDMGIDLIVSDIDMPNMDGIAFTRAVRESADFGDLPVILVSSLESREHQEQGMHAGANAYIVKRGFDQAQLLATIERFL